MDNYSHDRCVFICWKVVMESRTDVIVPSGHNQDKEGYVQGL